MMPPRIARRLRMVEKQKRLAQISDGLVAVGCPYAPNELSIRHESYASLSRVTFARLNNEIWQRPTEFTYLGKSYSVQFSHCGDPFCRWYGLPQTTYDAPRNPSRYTLSGGESRVIACHPDPNNLLGKPVLRHYSSFTPNIKGRQENHQTKDAWWFSI